MVTDFFEMVTDFSEMVTDKLFLIVYCNAIISKLYNTVFVSLILRNAAHCEKDDLLANIGLEIFIHIDIAMLMTKTSDHTFYFYYGQVESKPVV